MVRYGVDVDETIRRLAGRDDVEFGVETNAALVMVACRRRDGAKIAGFATADPPKCSAIRVIVGSTGDPDAPALACDFADYMNHRLADQLASAGVLQP